MNHDGEETFAAMMWVIVAITCVGLIAWLVSSL